MSEKIPAYIIDIDGTIAIHQGRSPFDYSKCNTDLVNEPLAEILRLSVEIGRAIIFVTGRPESCRELTTNWLDDNCIPHDTLHMRATEDRRADNIVKQEIYDNHIKNEYDVIGVFEDRLRVCRMWHQNGLMVFRVGDPDNNF